MVEDNTEKDLYIKEQLVRAGKFWLNLALPLGIFIFLFLASLDYLITPQHFKLFLFVRVSIAAILALFWFLNNLKSNRLLQDSIVIIGSLLSAVAIEIMILFLGGYSSGYYAGLMLLIVCALGFVPVDMWVAIIVVIEVFLVYLVPILLTQHISNIPLFVNNLFFLTSLFIAALAWRYLNQKNLLNEISLQYNLAQERAKLEEYSTQLERLVEERTKELNKSERLLRFMFDNANDGIVILDPSGEIVNANKRACEIYGFTKESLIGTNIQLLDAEADQRGWKEHLRRLLKGESLLFETAHYRRDGTKVTLEVSANALEIEGGKVLIQTFLRDITEKKRYQEQLLQSQKMESIGVLAGGIAHDFNNMLSVILGHTEMLLMEEDLDQSFKRKLAKIERSARSASQLARKLLKFAKRKEQEHRHFIELNRLIQETVELLKGNLPSNIVLNCELCKDPSIVEGDIGDMEQVLINLILNARDAMPEGGEIKIKTEIADLSGGTFIDGHMVSGCYVHITVSDEGTGIPSEYITRIFEPFFTTKEKGIGTGLGLAMVYGIVKDHNGHITVESEEGEGTTFHLYIPLAPKAVPEEEAFERAEEKNILVIDDDPLVLEYVKEILGSRGFNVVATDKPLLGVRLYKNNLRKISLVITDLVMPFMDGVKVMENIRGLDPSAKFIVISGFLDDYKDLDAHGILRKPFTPESLVQMVHTILDKDQGN